MVASIMLKRWYLLTTRKIMMLKARDRLRRYYWPEKAYMARLYEMLMREVARLIPPAT